EPPATPTPLWPSTGGTGPPAASAAAGAASPIPSDVMTALHLMAIPSRGGLEHHLYVLDRPFVPVSRLLRARRASVGCAHARLRVLLVGRRPLASDSESCGFSHGLRSVRDAKLAQDRGDVVGDGLLGKEQAAGDFRVVQPVGNEG